MTSVRPLALLPSATKTRHLFVWSSRLRQCFLSSIRVVVELYWTDIMLWRRCHVLVGGICRFAHLTCIHSELSNINIQTTAGKISSLIGLLTALSGLCVGFPDTLSHAHHSCFQIVAQHSIGWIDTLIYWPVDNAGRLVRGRFE